MKRWACGIDRPVATALPLTRQELCLVLVLSCDFYAYLLLSIHLCFSFSLMFSMHILLSLSIHLSFSLSYILFIYFSFPPSHPLSPSDSKFDLFRSRDRWWKEGYPVMIPHTADTRDITFWRVKKKEAREMREKEEYNKKKETSAASKATGCHNMQRLCWASRSSTRRR